MARAKNGQRRAVLQRDASTRQRDQLRALDPRQTPPRTRRRRRR